MYHELTDNMHRKVLKGTRYLLMINPENLKQHEKVDERAQLQEALQLNESLAAAYYLKEDLRQFWNQRSKPAAEKYLEAWCRRADASGIRQVQVMAKTLRGHSTGLLNWYDHPLSTGPLERTYNIIGALPRRAYSYQNYEHLKERLLTLHHTKFTLQRLIPCQCPSPPNSRMNPNYGDSQSPSPTIYVSDARTRFIKSK